MYIQIYINTYVYILYIYIYIYIYTLYYIYKYSKYSKDLGRISLSIAEYHSIKYVLRPFF